MVVEAASRIGGRCWTDTETFGVPYDVGAHWMHYGANNFYLQYGKQNGFSIYPDSRNFHFFRHDREQPGGDAVIRETRDQFEAAIQIAADKNLDISIEEATDELAPFEFATIDFIYGPWIMGKEVADFSVLDYVSAPDSEDWFCREGFGSIISHYGSGLPVSLNTKATEVDWSGNGVKVKTSKGTIEAKAALVTVSTGVLKAGGLKFSPTLSKKKQKAFRAISMGCYEHIVLQFDDGNLFGESDSYVIRMWDEKRECFGALVNVCGSGLAFCDIGGQTARDLIAEGDEACIDYALSQLIQIAGSNVADSFIKGAASGWLNHPFSLGAYASAKPGKFHMRETLRESVGERIFFAGEACHPTLWASVAGAHLSGQEVAREIVRLLQ